MKNNFNELKERIKAEFPDNLISITPYDSSLFSVKKETNKLLKYFDKLIKRLSKKIPKNIFYGLAKEYEFGKDSLKLVLRLDWKNLLLEKDVVYIAYGDPLVYDKLLSQSGTDARRAMWQTIHDAFGIRLKSKFLEEILETDYPSEIKHASPDLINAILREAFSYHLAAVQQENNKVDDTYQKAVEELFLLDQQYSPENRHIQDIVNNSLYISMIEANNKYIIIENEIQDDLQRNYFDTEKFSKEISLYQGIIKELIKNPRKEKERLEAYIKKLVTKKDSFSAFLLIKEIIENNKDKYIFVSLPAYKPEKHMPNEKHAYHALKLSEFLNSYDIKTKIIPATEGRIIKIAR